MAKGLVCALENARGNELQEINGTQNLGPYLLNHSANWLNPLNDIHGAALRVFSELIDAVGGAHINSSCIELTTLKGLSRVTRFLAPIPRE
jgi:hypothetical protein